jgi:hypothetical protein
LYVYIYISAARFGITRQQLASASLMPKKKNISAADA